VKEQRKKKKLVKHLKKKKLCLCHLKAGWNIKKTHMISSQDSAEKTHNKHTEHIFSWIIIGFIIDITFSWL